MYLFLYQNNNKINISFRIDHNHISIHMSQTSNSSDLSSNSNSKDLSQKPVEIKKDKNTGNSYTFFVCMRDVSITVEAVRKTFSQFGQIEDFCLLFHS